MPKYQAGDRGRLQDAAEGEPLPPHLVGRTRVVVRYTGLAIGPAGEPQYLVRVLKLHEQEEATHSVSEGCLARVSWTLQAHEFVQHEDQILRHEAYHANLEASRRTRRREEHEVNHRFVQAACMALLRGTTLFKVGNRFTHPLEWLRNNDPDWLSFEESLRQTP